MPQHIFGQPMAIKHVNNRMIFINKDMIRKELGWTRKNKPIVFLFVGPSGVGKTELAKKLALYKNIVN